VVEARRVGDLGAGCGGKPGHRVEQTGLMPNAHQDRQTGTVDGGNHPLAEFFGGLSGGGPASVECRHAQHATPA
jgi:hypothetical protein